jgi:hypothetical protein
MKRYTDQEIIDAVASSSSYAQVIEKLGRRPAGGNYVTVQKHIRRLQLDTSHFSGQIWNKGKIFSGLPVTDYLVQGGKEINSHRLKNKLLASGLKQFVCETCGNSEWLGHPIPLELHHIDGDHTNNTINNLVLICPNCHTFTPNYRGKGIKQNSWNCPKPQLKPEPKKRTFCECGTEIQKRSRRCVRCARLALARISWPQIEQLVEMIEDSSFSSVAQHLGVSDNAVRKHVKNHCPQ